MENKKILVGQKAKIIGNHKGNGDGVHHYYNKGSIVTCLKEQTDSDYTLFTDKKNCYQFVMDEDFEVLTKPRK